MFKKDNERVEDLEHEIRLLKRQVETMRSNHKYLDEIVAGVRNHLDLEVIQCPRKIELRKKRKSDGTSS